MGEERRLVTVLFADVSGSSGLVEGTDPEEVRTLLARFIEIARGAVVERGGTVEKFIGDAVMAIFGIPHAHEDDAARAISAALILRDQVRAHPELGERLPIRLGIATGEVVASTDVTGGDFIVTGDAANVAARLQQVADEWEVLVSARTARAAGPAFAFGEARTILVHGRRAPLVARGVLGPAGTTAPRRSPFVGRLAEVAQLALVAAQTFAGRRPALVTVVAAAGVGKSRLVEEFVAHRLADVAPGARVIAMRCAAYGQRVTYEPLRPLLVELVGAEGESPDELTAHLVRWLAGAGDVTAEHDAQLLSATVGATEVEVADRSLMFGAWRRLLELAARSTPLLLVVEDLHWASDSVVDLLEHALQPASPVPLLGLVLTRPELLDRRPEWGGGRANSYVVGLEPLAADDIRRVVRRLVGAQQAGLVEQIVARADGNPFYAEELARGVLERTAGTAELPDTVQATILARLDLLDPAARRLLQVGSVLGRRFSITGVAAIDDAPIADPATVESLVRRDFAVQEGHGDLSFRHALIQEVAGQTLPRVERSRLHSCAARWLEDTAQGAVDQVAEVIAVHLADAVDLQQSAGREVDAELRRQATVAARRAGEVAFRAAASAEAEAHVRAAIGLAGEDVSPDLYELLGDVVLTGDPAIEAYVAALDLARRSGWPVDDQLRLLGKQLIAHARWQGAVATRLPEASMDELLADGDHLLELATDDRAVATYLIARGFLPFWRAAGGRSIAADPTARAGVERGLRLAGRLRDPLLQSAALDALAGIAQSAGDHLEARERAAQRIAFEDRLDLTERLDAHAFYAWESCLLGEFEAAERATREVIQFVEPERAPTAALHAVAWRTFSLAMLGRWDEALASAALAEAVWRALARPAAGYAAHGFLVANEICRARGNAADAEHWRSVLDMTCSPFPAGSFARTPLAIAEGDRAAVIDAIVHPVALVERPHMLTRALALCADAGWALAEGALEGLEREARAQALRPMLAAVQRVRGLQDGDAGRLRDALSIASTLCEWPLTARLQVELGRLVGDVALMSEGSADLEALGDRTRLAGA